MFLNVVITFLILIKNIISLSIFNDYIASLTKMCKIQNRRKSLFIRNSKGVAINGHQLVNYYSLPINVIHITYNYKFSFFSTLFVSNFSSIRWYKLLVKKSINFSFKLSSCNLLLASGPIFFTKILNFWLLNSQS